MFKSRSRRNEFNNAPVNKPTSFLGFFYALKHILERAGATHKEKPLTKPLYMYFYHKQFMSIILCLIFLSSCNPAFAEPIKLTASWYSMGSLKKEGTFKYSKGVQANGKLFDENALTCASCDFPLKTRLRVTNVKNPRKTVVVEVTDRTNKRFKGKRVDLSKRAFMEIADCKQGLCAVVVERIK